MRSQRTNAVHVSKDLEEGRALSRRDAGATKWILNMKRNEGEQGRRRDEPAAAESTKTTEGTPEEKAASRSLRSVQASRGTPQSVEAKPGKKQIPRAQSALGMTSARIDAESLWKQVEDAVVPGLRLSVIDHVVYFHLLRHSRLEGKRRLKFSIPWLARNIHLSTCPTREAVRRLAAQGALRLVERSKAGHVVEVRLPEEIRGVRANGNRAREAARRLGDTDIEDVNFLKTLELRRAIHARERGKCFYCLRRITPRLECLDHVVPRARVGCNSYRNLVSACMECNSQKGERPAEEYLRWLFREHRLGAAELRDRFQALELLASGKLRPELPSEEGEGSRES